MSLLVFLFLGLLVASDPWEKVQIVYAHKNEDNSPLILVLESNDWGTGYRSPIDVPEEHLKTVMEQICRKAVAAKPEIVCIQSKEDLPRLENHPDVVFHYFDEYGGMAQLYTCIQLFNFPRECETTLMHFIFPQK